MGRCISNLVALLVIIGITIAVGVFVSRFISGGIISAYDKPNHLQISSKVATLITQRTIRIEVVFNNPTNYAFCIKLDRVALYTSSTAPQETVSVAQTSPDITVAIGSSIKYEMILYTSNTYSSGVAVAYFNMYACSTTQTCGCSGTPSYSEALSIRF